MADETIGLGDEAKGLGNEAKGLGDEAKALGDEIKALGDEAKALGDETKGLPRFVLLATHTRLIKENFHAREKALAQTMLSKKKTSL